MHDRQHQLQARELISQAYNLIQELTQGLSNFYTYSEQRVQAYHQESNSDPLSDANDKVYTYHLYDIDNNRINILIELLYYCILWYATICTSKTI